MGNYQISKMDYEKLANGEFIVVEHAVSNPTAYNVGSHKLGDHQNVTYNLRVVDSNIIKQDAGKLPMMRIKLKLVTARDQLRSLLG